MPMRLPFNFPYFYNNYRYPNNSIRKNKMQNQYFYNNVKNNNTENNNIAISYSNSDNQKKPENSNSENTSEPSDCFFEIFGLKLHFDDVLIMCILFFLYKEDVHDEELFLCLILLLIS